MTSVVDWLMCTYTTNTVYLHIATPGVYPQVGQGSGVTAPLPPGAGLGQGVGSRGRSRGTACLGWVLPGG